MSVVVSDAEAERVAVAVADVFRLFERYGASDYIGEPLSVTNHSIQTAMMARAEGQDDDVVVAALLHDIGHLVGAQSLSAAAAAVEEDTTTTTTTTTDAPPRSLPQMGRWGTADHDALGAAFLRARHVPERVCALVANHVSAKRYLVSVDPAYADTLSDASRHTLAYQGGAMTRAECDAYERDPLRALYVKFRQWEDRAKRDVPESSLPPLESFRAVVARVFATLPPPHTSSSSSSSS